MRFTIVFILAATLLDGHGAAEAASSVQAPTMVPCYATDIDSCNPTSWRLLAGTWYARLFPANTVYFNRNRFHSSQCTPGMLVATIGAGQKIVVAMGSQLVTDDVGTQSLFFEGGIEVHSWPNSNCSGSPLTFVGTDFPTYTSPIGTQQQMGYADYDSTCSGTQGEPSSPTFHLSDVTITRPSGIPVGTTRCYSIKIWSRVCTSAYTNCQPWGSSAGNVTILWN